MNRPLVFLATVLLATALVGAMAPQRPAQRWAVLIAADGTAERPWNPGLVEATKALESRLISDYGYSRDSVFALYNDQATRERTYLAWSDLRDRVSPGDSVFVYLALPEAPPTRALRPELQWLPWDSGASRTLSQISLSNTHDALGRLDGATVVYATPSCIDSFQPTVRNFAVQKSKSYRAEETTSIYSLSACAGGRPTEFTKALVDALDSGLGSNQQKFAADQLASYLDKSTRLTIRYNHQIGTKSGLEFVRERSALEPSLLAALDGADSKSRSSAIWRLVDFVNEQPAGRRGALTEELAERLLPLAESTTEEALIRNSAVAAVSRLGFEPAIPRLSAIAREGSSVSEGAVRALLGFGDKAARPLEELLSVPNAAVRTATIESLTRLGVKDSLPKIVSSMEGESDPKANVALLEAIQALSRNRDEAAERVAELLQSPSTHPEVRAQAINTLGSLGKSSALPVLEEILVTSSPDISRAAYAIAKIRADGDDRARVEGSLIQALRRGDEANLGAIAQALGKTHGSSAAVEPLIEALGRLPEGSSARSRVADALGSLGDTRAVAALMAELEDPLPSNRRVAASALGAIGDPRPLEALQRLTSTKEDAYVRRAADEAIESIRTASFKRASSDEIGDQIIVALGDPVYATRVRGQQALQQLSRERQVEVLSRALESDSVFARAEAARLLGGLAGIEGAVDHLLAHRDDSESSVRNEVVLSLNHFDDDRARAGLRSSVIEDRDQIVRINAAFSLLRQSQYLIRAGRTSEAAAFLDLAVNGHKFDASRFPHPFGARRLLVASQIDRAEGNLDRAAKQIHSALRLLKPDDDDPVPFLTEAAEQAEKRNEPKLAYGYYLEILQHKEKELGPDEPAVADTLDDLVRVVRATGSEEVADRFAARAKRIRESAAERIVTDRAYFWILNGDGTRNWLGTVPSACRSRARLVSDIERFPKRHGGANDAGYTLLGSDAGQACSGPLTAVGTVTDGNTVWFINSDGSKNRIAEASGECRGRATRLSESTGPIAQWHQRHGGVDERGYLLEGRDADAACAAGGLQAS